MKFVKLMSLILLFIICGTSGVFAQNTSKPMQRELIGLLNLEYPNNNSQSLLNIYEEVRRWTVNLKLEEAREAYEESRSNVLDNTHTVEDAYLLVFGNFGGEEPFFDQYFDRYPHDTNILVPEGIQTDFVCYETFWSTLNVTYFPRRTDYDSTCNPNENHNLLSLFHSVLRDTEVFVIPFRGRFSLDILRLAVSMVQADMRHSDEYQTALQIKSSILDYYVAIMRTEGQEEL